MRDDHRCLALVVAALALAGAAHMVRLPWWIGTWCLGLWALALYRGRRGLGPLGQRRRLAFTALGLMAATITWRLVPNTHLGQALLMVMIGLKPLEIRSHRDRVMTVFLTFFVIVCALLVHETMLMAVYLPAATVLATAALILSGHPEPGWPHALGRATRLLSLALVPALVVFLVFPRLEGRIWGHVDATRAVSGFSDRLAPGSLSSIGLNRQVVFRAQFDGAIPPVHQRYWRGIVFHRFDGRQWLRAALPPVAAKTTPVSEQIAYRITLEPTGRPWLLALDLPVSGPAYAWKLADNTLVARRPVRSRIRYAATSTPSPPAGPLSNWEKTTSALDERSNPRARQLAAGWAAAAQDPQALIDAALALFRTEGFAYSLQADTVAEDAIDHFLFVSRKGYCEHFATAFCFLMRAAGLPARIVGGYLGGQFNPFGNYLIVRESDAHVWVEVWLAERGWTRIDPTYQVAPARVEQGVDAALAGQGQADLPFFGWRLSRLRLGWDALEIYWGRWILGYSADHQRWLRDLLGQHRVIGTLVVAAAVVILALLARMALVRPRPKGSVRRPDPVKAAYQRFCIQLARAGIVRRPAEGPKALSRRLATECPALAGPAAEILDLYSRLRYGRTADAGLVNLLRAKVRRFGR